MNADRADQLAVIALAAIGLLGLPIFLWRERRARKAEVAEAWRAVFAGREVYVLSGGHGFDTTLRYGPSTNGAAR